MTSTGFPHSEISGSTPVCGSPKLFAANHVLHRLLTPRHSPCALSSLATNLMWNPQRVPHLRRSLRQAQLAFARVGGACPTMGSTPPALAQVGKAHPRSGPWDPGPLTRVIRSSWPDAAVPHEPKRMQLKSVCASLRSIAIRRLQG